MRRAGPRMSQHEHGFVVELLVPHRAAVKEPVAQREEGVQDGHARDEEQAGPVREDIHASSMSPHHPRPLRGGYAAQGVVLDAPEIAWAVVDDAARGKGRHHPADRGRESAPPTDDDWAPFQGKAKTREEVRISTRAFSSNLGTRVSCPSRGRLRARGRGGWGVTGERKK